MWENVFGMTGISIDDEFFDQLGGHSLLAAVMVSKLRQNPQFQDLAVLIIAVYPALILLSIPIKWLAIGRFKPGRYPLWSVYYWRFWLVRQVLSFVPVMLLTGSPLFNWYCRLMGAKISFSILGL